MDRGDGGSGSGFDLPGTKLSTEAHNPTSTRDGRLKGLKAAEERSRKQQLMSGGGQRLGGRSPPADRTPAQMAAEAALRRLRDDAWCHTSSDGGSCAKQGVSQEAPRSSSQAPSSSDGSSCAKQGLLREPASSGLQAPGCKEMPPPGRPNADKQPTPARSTLRSSGTILSDEAQSAPSKKAKVQRAHADWQCPACTLFNDASCSCCRACESSRPSVASKLAVTQPKRQRFCRDRCNCGTCTEGSGSSVRRGPCPACTYINVAADVSCAMCGAALSAAAGAASHIDTVIELD